MRCCPTMPSLTVRRYRIHNIPAVSRNSLSCCTQTGRAALPRYFGLGINGCDCRSRGQTNGENEARPGAGLDVYLSLATTLPSCVIGTQMQERPSAPVSLTACADNRPSHGGANPANCLGERRRARSPSVTLSLKEVRPVRAPDHTRFSSPVTPNPALAAPTVLQSAITAREPLLLLIAHIAKGSECYRCNAFEGSATSSRNAVSRKSGTTVGTHVSPQCPCRPGWGSFKNVCGSTGTRRADHRLESRPALENDPGLRPRLLKNSLSALPHRSATSRDGAKRYPSASVIVTVVITDVKIED